MGKCGLFGLAAIAFGVLSYMTAAAAGQESAIPADADNFYKSDTVTLQKVMFPNQYKMNVAGNLFLPKEMDWNNKYPFNDIETISPRPMLFIAGENAHSIEFSEDAFKRAADPKELVVVPGAGHVDLYDRVNLIPWEKLTAFFKTNLER